MGSLSNLYISQSYQSLIHIGTNNTASATLIGLQDGLGNDIGVSVNTAGDLFLSGSLTASLQQGYLYVGNASGKTSAFATSSLVTNIDTGSLVTTASFNSYTQSTNIRLNNLESTSASVNVSISNLNSTTSSFATSIANLNSNSASVNASISALNQATSSLFGSASLALVTASFDNGTRNLTFTKGDASTFNVNIPDVSGSTLNTASFATTGSNTFVGANTFSSSVDILGGLSIYDNSINIGYPKQMGDPYNTNIGVFSSFVYSPTGSLVLGGNQMTNSGVTILKGLGVTGSVVISPLPGMTPTGGDLNVYGTFTSSLQQGHVFVGDASGKTTTISTGSFITESETGSFVTTSSFNSYTSSTDNRLNNIETTTASLLVETQNLELFSASALISINALNVASASLQSFTSSQYVSNSYFATTGSNTFTGNQIISTAGNSQLTLIAQPGFQTNVEFQSQNSNFQAYGDFRVNNNGQFGGSGSIKFTTSNNFTEIAADQGIKIGATNGAGNGIDAGNISMQVRSGSLSLAAAGFNNTTASLTHLSSSSNTNNINLMFKNSNTAADTIISGSGNIFSNPTAPTAGFKRYMTGGNIGVGGSGAAVPQISGSMAFSPTISNNYFGVSANPLTIRGPVSSSAYNINNNVIAGGAINLGPNATSNFQRAVNGLNIQANLLASTITAVASKTELSASVGIGNNIMGSGLTLNMDSSSISFNSNIVQGGGLTINNSYFPATTGAQLATFVNGGLYIGTHTIFLSGSNTTFTGSPGRTINNCSMIGNFNFISASLNADLAQVNSTTLIGQGLVVVGSNSRAAGPSAADWGSVFVGRWNSIDGVKDQTAETVFAVGVGTSNTSRKTAFLIDSGSNTFVEGTLNVSGSTSHTGSITIQSGSGDLFMYGHKMFNVGAFSSTITQSGSAAVSQSMKFNTTDISEGVTLNGGGTQLIVANAGVYNIQFSAQLLSTTGIDDVYIWLKKNGTNVTYTGSRITLANNDELVAAWNFVQVAANANDYFEICWQTLNGHATLLAETATGNIPGIPSVIATVTQVR